MGGWWPRAECLRRMVVVPEPAVKRCCSFGAVAVDRCVGPSAEESADESLRLSVGLRTVGAGSEVPDAQAPAGERVPRGDVRAAVVGDHALDGDGVPAIESDSTTQEPDRCRGLFV